MENLVNKLVTMETTSLLRKDITDKIMSLVDEFNLLGEYRILNPFEVCDGNFAYAFEVEWCDHLHHSDGKTIYFYINSIEGDQVDGKFIWDIDVIPLELFYNNIISKVNYEKWF